MVIFALIMMGGGLYSLLLGTELLVERRWITKNGGWLEAGEARLAGLVAVITGAMLLTLPLVLIDNQVGVIACGILIATWSVIAFSVRITLYSDEPPRKHKHALKRKHDQIKY
jgi:VIT1/CCC1 family predicted Fe2+/Mn2+ transporter